MTEGVQQDTTGMGQHGAFQAGPGVILHAALVHGRRKSIGSASFIRTLDLDLARSTSQLQ